MFRTIGHTFELMKMSWRVLMKDRELIFFPLMSAGVMLATVGVFALIALSTGTRARRPQEPLALTLFERSSLALPPACFVDALDVLDRIHVEPLRLDAPCAEAVESPHDVIERCGCQPFSLAFRQVFRE